jgi:hypothetical protein
MTSCQGDEVSKLRKLRKICIIKAGPEKGKKRTERGETSKVEEKYYTAQQAQQILGMTYSALRNQVNAGNLQSIVPPGKRQAVYLREEVDQLKKDMDAWLTSRQQTKAVPTEYARATMEDMPEAVALADEIFGSHLTIPLERRIAWLKKNPDIDYLLKQEGQVVGYVSVVPLQPETIAELLSQRRFAKDLTADDILPFTPDTPVDLYGMAIGVRPGVSLNQKRIWGAALILGIRSTLQSLGQRGIIIHHIQAHSSKPDGIRFMRHLGFTETVSILPGMHNFTIDVEQSGLPIIKEYKEALKKWQADHKKQSVGDRK